MTKIKRRKKAQNRQKDALTRGADLAMDTEAYFGVAKRARLLRDNSGKLAVALAMGASLAAAPNAHATVIHTVMDLDFSFTDFKLDLDGDGTDDFYFYHTDDGPGEPLEFWAINNYDSQNASTGILTRGPNGQTYEEIDLLTNSYNLTTSGNWFTSSSAWAIGFEYSSQPAFPGLWENADHKFMGLRVGDNLGWARFSISETEGIFHDYAYETEAGKSLYVGDTGTPVPEPSSFVLMAVGASMALGLRKHQRARKKKAE